MKVIILLFFKIHFCHKNPFLTTPQNGERTAEAVVAEYYLLVTYLYIFLWYIDQILNWYPTIEIIIISLPFHKSLFLLVIPSFDFINSENFLCGFQ